LAKVALAFTAASAKATGAYRAGPCPKVAATTLCRLAEARDVAWATDLIPHLADWRHQITASSSRYRSVIAFAVFVCPEPASAQWSCSIPNNYAQNVLTRRGLAADQQQIVSLQNQAQI